MYVPSAILRGIVDILDAGSLEKLITVGHDWYASTL